ncbi:hypothetical protein ACXYTJ_14510 [Gilvimarinus sp. F26214L]|uniref:hypothetical protein n=1 Tax=Gilvimarinus sp. DZF01 TaxID=3461371 RepID=UPI00404682C9
MDYCSYHPLTPATFSCLGCHTHNCDRCVNEGDPGQDPTCFSCEQAMESLGAVNQATPFWRRLEESFRYPLNMNTMVLIIGVSFLSIVFAKVPFSFLWLLILNGAFLKYSFSCLENTAGGTLVAPDITEAYSGGLRIILHLFLMTVFAGVVIAGAARFLGMQFAGAVAIFLVVATPAILILYALSDSVVEALNPASIIRLISAIGLPYGLLLAFIMIMTASVGVINQLFVSSSYSALSTALQSMVGNYYSVVMFHLMGYVIFQYQGELGFVAREDFGEDTEPRSQRDRLAAKLDILVKEGDYNGVVTLLDTAARHFPDDRELNRMAFEFFYATRRRVEAAASSYLDYLIRSGQDHQLVLIYKRVLHLAPGYRPPSPDTRYRLAQACRDGGDSLSAAKLLKGMHLEFPDYPRLVQAYELLTEALEDLPHQGEQARKCREFTRKLARVTAQKLTASKGRAVFGTGTSHNGSSSTDTGEPKTPAKQDNDSKSDLPPIDFK